MDSNKGHTSQARTLRLSTKVNRALAEMCGWMLILVVIFMVTDLVARGMSRPLYGVSELAMFTMIAIVYLGLSQAEEEDSHIRVEFLIDKAKGRYSKVLHVFIVSVTLLTVVIITWALWDNAITAFNSKQAISGPTPIVVYPVKFVMFFAFLVYGLQLLFKLFPKNSVQATLK